MQPATAARMHHLAMLPVCVVVVLSVGCSPANTPQKAGISATYDSKTGKLTELAYDSNHNGKVDTWTEMDGNRAVRTRIDRNEDGRIDRWEYYDDRSNLVKVGFSRADTGKPDAWAFAGEGGKSRVEISSTFDEHKIDRWEHYVGETITAAEEDTNGDGIIDKWETYEEGYLKTASFDEDGNGTVDRRLRYADGTLVEIDSDPDPTGTFRKHLVGPPFR